MFEVLEHLENPSKSMEKIKELLLPEGYLVLSVPYRGSWNKFKFHDKPPRHLTRWDETSMKNFLTARGFSIVRMKIIPASLAYIITKYHFWYRGIFSFGMVEKLSADQKSEKNTIHKIKNNARKIKLLQMAARLKDYILFFIPAATLYLHLSITGQRGLTLYVLAKRVN